MGALSLQTNLASPPLDRLAEVREALVADRLIPYLGPGVLSLGGAAVPASPEAVAAALNKLAPAPQRIRTNMWSVAQFIEGRRHRKTLTKYMSDLFAPPSEPNELQAWLARLPLALMVDAWYDGALAAALRRNGRQDFVEVQGATRAGIAADIWTRSYDAAGAALATTPEAATVLYAPHGAVRPAQNFLVADSDYVEVLTEIDIQSPIPDIVKARRATRGFLFLGCRFHDQMLRTYARQIMKRSAGPHYAIVEAATLTRNERKFLVDQQIEILDVALPEAAALLIG